MPSNKSADEAPDGSKILVMTGGTSGFGRRALERVLGERPEWSVILLARASARLDEIEEAAAATNRLAIIEVDLASLASVEAAVQEVIVRLGGRAIDAMALNAGIQALNGDR